MYNPGSRDVHEEACARKQGLTLEPETTTEETDMACNDCVVKDSEVERLGKDLAERKSEVSRLTEERDQAASGHPSLADMLQHGRVEGCADCSQALKGHNQAVIKKALEEISPEALRQLAIERKVIPERITVEVPD